MSGAQTVRRMGRPPSPVVAVRNDAIVALFKLGARPDEIAVQMGIATATVYRLISDKRRDGAVIPRRRHAPKARPKHTEWSDKLIAKMNRLLDAGHSTREVGMRMGLTKNQIIGKSSRLAVKQNSGAPA